MKIQHYIPIMKIFSVELFFSVATIIGYEYTGIDFSKTYVIYNIIFFTLALSIFIYDLDKNNYILYMNQLLLLTIPIIVTFAFLCEYLFGIVGENVISQYIYFILWPTTSILMGIYVSKNNRLRYFVKYLDIICLIFSFATINIIITAFTENTTVSIGGTTYQYAGYVIAIAFGINLYLLNFGYNYERFKFTKTKLYKLISLSFLILQIIGVIVSGARGPMILIIVYTITIFATIFFNPKQLLKFLIIILSIIFILSMFWSHFLQIPIFRRSLDRAFSYITDQGIDLSKTSGRDILYSTAIKYIAQKPLLGYGLFGMWKKMGFYPHNLFLEVLLQGGILYLFVFLILIYLSYNKFRSLVKLNNEIIIIGILSLYPLVQLLFSGSYLTNSMFWFCFSFIWSHPISKVDFIKPNKKD